MFYTAWILLGNNLRIFSCHSSVPFGLETGYSIVTNWWRGWPEVSKIVLLSSGAFMGWLKCWAHLGLSICTSHGLSTMVTSMQLDFLHLVQNSKSKCASRQGRSLTLPFMTYPQKSLWVVLIRLKAVEIPLSLRETPNSKSL